MTTYALLVGIDDYPRAPLHGCVADVEAFARVLSQRVADSSCLLLRDAEATRAGLIEAMRGHLGRAGPDDVAVLYYAGHGGEERAPPDIATLEGTTMLQTLMLHGTGRDPQTKRPVRGLADKELAVLLAEVGERAGHLAVLLDCCHSGDADRDPASRVRAWPAPRDTDDDEWRAIGDALIEPRPMGDFYGGDRAGWLSPVLRHVTLSACRGDQRAKEHPADGTTRGVFSSALEESLVLLGPDATYRTLLATVRSRVLRATGQQEPVLAVHAPGLGDARVFDGTITPAPRSFRMTRSGSGFVIDGGAAHGLADADGDRAFVLACRTERAGPDAGWAGEVRVVRVSAGTASVEPLGWDPDDVAYVAVVVAVPSALAEVRLDPAPAALEAFGAEVQVAVSSALARSGPAGGSSPDVRLVGDDESTTGALRLRVAVTAPDRVEIRRADGTPVPGGAVDVAAAKLDHAAEVLVARLAHVARWERICRLGDHPAPHDVAVALELFPSRQGEDGRRPPDRLPLASAPSYELVYSQDGDELVEPYIYARLVNPTDRRLHAAVLVLSERFECQVFQPTATLDPGATLELAGGRHVSVTLLDDVLGVPGDVDPGDRSREVLVTITSEEPFDAAAFALPALEASTRRSRRPLDQDPPRSRWSAQTVTLEVVAPGPHRNQ